MSFDGLYLYCGGRKVNIDDAAMTKVPVQLGRRHHPLPFDFVAKAVVNSLTTTYRECVTGVVGKTND
jgi:hypothetical protein